METCVLDRACGGSPLTRSMREARANPRRRLFVAHSFPLAPGLGVGCGCLERRLSLPGAGSNYGRRHDMPIIWTQSDHSAPFGGVMLKKFPTIREDKYLWKGQPSFELYDQMPPPQEGEYRVVKHKYDAFFETDLDSILRNNRIKTIVIVGN